MEGSQTGGEEISLMVRKEGFSCGGKKCTLETFSSLRQQRGEPGILSGGRKEIRREGGTVEGSRSFFTRLGEVKGAYLTSIRIVETR